MTTPPVSYRYADSIATITMDDGKANVMSEEMLKALNAALDRAEQDHAVVLLTGRERMFSGGFDLALFRSSPEAITRTLRMGGELTHRLLGFPRPVVAACTGHAVAMGAFVLLAADERVGAAGAFKIGLNEVVIGLTVPYFAVETARCRLAVPWFNHATTTGALYAPEEARAAGFFDRVVAPEQVSPVAQAAAQQLTKIDMKAHEGTKQRVRGPALQKIREGIDREFPLG